MSGPRVTDTGCPHPDSSRLTIVPGSGRFSGVETVTFGSRSQFTEVETRLEPVAWCRMCGSLCRDGVWTEPTSIVLPGWHCAKCGVFNGAAKELRGDCRSCGTPFDMEETT